MATRATIFIEGVEFAKVYKHWSGCPEDTLDWLKEFNKRFTQERGNDPEYKFAQLLRNSIKNAEKYKLDKSEFTGWGVFDYYADCGEEFLYLLKTDGSVYCIESDWNKSTKQNIEKLYIRQ